MTNHADSEEILIDQQNNKKKGQISNTLDKPHTLKTLQKKKYMPGSEQRGAVLEKNKEILQDRQLTISLKKQVVDPYASQDKDEDDVLCIFVSLPPPPPSPPLLFAIYCKYLGLFRLGVTAYGDMVIYSIYNFSPVIRSSVIRYLFYKEQFFSLPIFLVLCYDLQFPGSLPYLGLFRLGVTAYGDMVIYSIYSRARL